MQLEDYFHLIKRKQPMKDTRVSFSISQDNDDLQDYPNTSYSMHNEYEGAMWIKILEDVIRVLESSYGYDIKSKVFYAVECPLFDHNVSPAPERELDRKLFMRLLKRYPELNNGGEHEPLEPFFTEEDDEDSSYS